MQKSENNKKGFTLVELLVVIAIIALLLSILMPSLQKARGQASAVMCGSNQKQILMATLLYAEDYKGRVPYFQNPTWVASKREYMVLTDGWLGAILPYAKAGGKLETLKFQGATYYTQKAFAAIGNCPSIKDPGSRKRPWSFGVNYPNVIDYSGKLTAAAGGASDYVAKFRWEPLKISQIPTGTMAFMDAGAWRWWVYNMSLFPLNTGAKDEDGIFPCNKDLQSQSMGLAYNGATFPHSKMANVGLMSGSVVRMSKKDICRNANDVWGSRLNK
jgi:prepilin-type N-terminal cleavage/methylation domain-containing protein